MVTLGRGVRVSALRGRRNCNSCIVDVSSFVMSRHDPLRHSLESRVDADDATVECLGELEMFFLRTLHICNVNRVVVRLQVLVSLDFWIAILVHRVGDCEAHCLSSSVLIASPGYKASLLWWRLQQ